jgi:alanyl-tRNA synthetase
VRLEKNHQALAQAVTAITAKHGDALAALLISVDKEKGKVMAYAGVPDGLLPKIKAPEWLGAALSVVGGKGGGKPGGAQGQGSDVGRADEAVAAAEKFAALAL